MTLSADELKELRAKAEAATPGPWEADDFVVWREVAVPIMVPVCCGNGLPSGECCGDPVPDVEWEREQAYVTEVQGDNAPSDATFIAALNPATALSLIQAAELNAELVEALERISEMTPGAANAADARALHLTVKAIADEALSKAKGSAGHD